MGTKPSRRDFLGTAKTACGAVALLGLSDSYASGADSKTATKAIQPGAVHAGFPRQSDDEVSEVVGASHTRFERVKELVTARPALAKASWDWGFGDWESALGAASHTGRRDIAELLIAHGARPNIFTFAMLGELPAVRGMVEAIPGIQRTRGPHGITLLRHAKSGLRSKELSRADRKKSEELVHYLESLGDADVAATSLEVADKEKTTYLGRYTFGAGPDDALTVGTHQRGWLTIKRGDQSARRLNLVESHTFAPAGAPQVRIRFDFANGQAKSLTVHDPMPMVKALRATG